MTDQMSAFGTKLSHRASNIRFRGAEVCGSSVQLADRLHKLWLRIIKIIQTVETDRIRKNGNGAFFFRTARIFLYGRCGPTMTTYFAISLKV